MNAQAGPPTDGAPPVLSPDGAPPALSADGAPPALSADGVSPTPRRLPSGRLRGPLGALLAAAPPDLATARHAVRWTYAIVFLAQTLLALAVSLGQTALLGTRGRPSDVLAGVLLAMSLLHVPVGLALGYALAGRPGRGAAVASATAAAVALSVTAWFAALMAVSNQRTSFLVAAFVVVALAYLAGFALTPRCARAALRPEPGAPGTPEPTPAAPGALEPTPDPA